MSWYIIDGYNLIKSSQNLKTLPLSEAKQRLRVIAHKALSCTQKIKKITVVFDGYPDVPWSLPVRESMYEEIFSAEESADDRIKRIIRTTKTSRKIVVVTYDREIAEFARLHNAGNEKPLNFVAKISQKPKNPDEKVKPEKIIAINTELLERWHTKYKR